MSIINSLTTFDKWLYKSNRLHIIQCYWCQEGNRKNTLDTNMNMTITPFLISENKWNVLFGMNTLFV